VKRENCVYCERQIEKRSREHIIQNAIGGLFESEDICCPACNEYISKYIDAPFTKTFNPIIGMIENFAKTNNKKSQPPCTGKALYDNELYDVKIKGGKVVDCPELSQKLKCNISKFPFEILAYDFPIENVSFNNGISKIAFNFALAKGISFDVLNKGVDIRKTGNKIEGIMFKYPLTPFVALNPMDKYIELNTDMELYHNLILFNQNNMLWCYVDLFNTFQYYVLLSDEWDENIPVQESYLQLLQKIDRTIPELYIRKPKHILTYAMYYNVEPCIELDTFKKRVVEAIKKESLKKDMSDVLSAKLRYDYLKADKLKEMELDERNFRLGSFLLYFDEDDRLKNSTFRKVTMDGNGTEVVSYPLFINILVRNGAINVRPYTFAKFDRLNAFLCGIDNAKNYSKD
jgi:hypothetical protein